MSQFFSILCMAALVHWGALPSEAEQPCSLISLLAASPTIQVASGAPKQGHPACCMQWSLTWILIGAVFLAARPEGSCWRASAAGQESGQGTRGAVG